MADYIFISYAHENGRFVRRLAHDLAQQGLSVWLDQWDLSEEADWDQMMKQAIRSCRYLLLVLSPAAVNSWVVYDQFMLALRTGKTIVPVVHQPCELPLPLQNLTCIDFTDHDYKSTLRQLLAHYFPHQSVQLEPEARAAWGGLSWSWRRNFLPMLVETTGDNYKTLVSQVITHYFPAQLVGPEYETGAVALEEEVRWSWLDRLLSLLWPGWLGPLILSLFLVAATFSFWPDDNGMSQPPVPAVVTLEIIRPTATPPSVPTPIETMVRFKDGKIMVYIPAGEFLMGSAETDLQADDDEKPLHSIYLDAFWIDKTEITNSQYQLCLNEGRCMPPQKLGKRFEEDYQPVIGVNWLQAAAYCEWSGGRLPTEAEWEKAARGVDGRIYPWGDRFDGSRLNFCDINCIADWKDRRADDGYEYTAPVGNYPKGASPYGVLDMSGNVWEWTADWYDPHYYANSPLKNPTGPASGQQRVVRGGSWYYYGTNLRVPNRHRDSPTYRYDNIGFRCVVDG
jgi:formylglycine-generating enzyme required for sulfatase activity